MPTAFAAFVSFDVDLDPRRGVLRELESHKTARGGHGPAAAREGAGARRDGAAGARERVEARGAERLRVAGDGDGGVEEDLERAVARRPRVGAHGVHERRRVARPIAAVEVRVGLF